MGSTDEERARNRPYPLRHGPLGVLLHEGDQLAAFRHGEGPAFRRLPAESPADEVAARRAGGLARTHHRQSISYRQTGSPAFDDTDEEIVRMLATQAAAAIETRRLQEQLESLARLQERERIAMDLHDGVIQSVYATALHLEDAEEKVSPTAR